jgi:ABC-type dipeptide/oligopeptide/nickel transport system ATPase component
MSALADTVAVMRSGRVVEHGSRYQVLREPSTDYARELIAALPQTPPPGAGLEAPGSADPEREAR